MEGLRLWGKARIAVIKKARFGTCILMETRSQIEPSPQRTVIGARPTGSIAELAQFALVGTAGQPHLPAAGPRAREGLRAALKAGTCYNPGDFDSDRYPISRLDERFYPVTGGKAWFLGGER
jgi:hypothetical protein